jgi:hypothetical protein
MPTNCLTLQLLAWVDDRPRTYGETMEAWRTTCPRLTIWEDAVSDGLLLVEKSGTMRDARVLVTEAGRILMQTEPARPGGVEQAPTVHL